MISAIKTARYVNSEHTAAIIKRKNGDDAMISENDTPLLWTELNEWNGKIKEFSEPDQPEKLSATDKLTAFIKANPDVAALIK